MRTHPLIRHPVGRMSAAARWYLAGVAMLALMLIAIHFAIQVYAQQEAKRLVSSWAEETGFSVSDVRYRMLRGALTLVDVRFNSEHLQVYAPTLFLHGNLVSLSGDKPQATRVELRGAEIKLTEETLQELLKGETGSIPLLFHQLWNSAQRIGIYQTSFKWLPEGDHKLLNDPFSNRSTVINLVRLESVVVSGERTVEGLAHWLDGEMTLATQTVLKDGVAYLSDGSLNWKGLDAAIFLGEILSLSALPGKLNGALTWKQKRDDHALFTVNGSAGIEDSADVGKASRLIWNGSLSEGKWKGDIKSTAWPLAMFSHQLPYFQRYKLAAGRFDGAFKLAGNLNRWQMDMIEAELSGIQYRKAAIVNGAATENFPEWHVETLHVSNARLQWPEHKIYATNLAVRNTNFIVDSRGVEPVDRGWNIEIKEMSFNQASPVIRLADGLFSLPMLEGEASLKSNGRLQLKLDSSDRDSEELVESWHISGSGMLAMKGSSRFKLDVRVERAALVRFRPFMPEVIRRDASDISGDVDLKLSLQAGSYPWEGSGEVSITDVHLQHAGEQWHAKTMNIIFEKIGSKLEEQQIHQVDVKDWYYQAALRPLLPSEANRPEVDIVEPIRGDVESVKAERWHVQDLLLSNGLISVGHPDAVWADSVEIHIKDLRPGVVAPVEVKAKLGGGSLTVKGALDWDRAMPELHKAKILVRDTLPFFLNDWLTVSSMPQLIRGRIYADFSLQREKGGAYKGLGYLRLQHGVLGQVLSENDPLLSRVGFNTHDIFASLQNAGRIHFRVPLHGEGAVADVIGDSLVKVIKRDMEKQGYAIKPVAGVVGHLFSSVRLHERGSFSPNERVRLRKIIRYLLKNPKQTIELKPQLSLSSQGDRQIERVRYTQQLIEEFLTHRGISRARIFPVWPSEQHRSSSSTSGIGIVTIP